MLYLKVIEFTVNCLIAVEPKIGAAIVATVSILLPIYAMCSWFTRRRTKMRRSKDLDELYSGMGP